MFTDQEIEILQTDSIRETIHAHRTQDPAQVALCLTEYRALIATQIKYLQRAKVKLPAYYQAGCILPPLSFEQCSSMESAATKHYVGDVCVDLTCGLGVDALHFAQTFTRVITLERDPILARVARINFERLGAHNIEVINTSAEEFLAQWTQYFGSTDVVDLIYVDPDRRAVDGRKLFLLEECSPNVVELLPSLRAKSRRVVIKTSPLFDVEEAYRKFGAEVTVEVVSLRGECKEVVIDLPAEGKQQGMLKATIAGGASLEFPRQRLESTQNTASPFTPPYAYLLVPDVALYKSRTLKQYATQLELVAPTETGYCYANNLPTDFFGRCFAIESWDSYQPKSLKTRLKAQGIKRATLMKRDFSDELTTLTRALGITQGGNHLIALTQIAQHRYALTLKPIP